MFKEGESMMEFNLAYLNECDNRARISFFKEISLNEFKQIFKDHPELASLLISDLLAAQDYTDVEISFGSGISLEIIRGIRKGQSMSLHLNEQLELIRFYLRVFVKYGYGATSCEKVF